MALDRKLEEWEAAGLIDAAAANRIRAHEAAGQKPTLMWAIIGLGLLALVLGVMLLISANWDHIPDPVKLTVHLLAAAGVAAAIWRSRLQGKRWLAEALLCGFAGLVMAGIALQAQIFQLTGPAWQALLLWLLLAGPALLLGGITRVSAYFLAALAVVGPALMVIDTYGQGGWWPLWHGLAMAVPMLLLGLSQVVRLAPPPFRAGLREAGIVLVLAAASVVHFAWAYAIDRTDALDNLVRFGPVAAATALTVLAARAGRELPAALILPLTTGPLLAGLVALGVPHPDHVGSRLVGLAIFIAMWAWVAYGAARSGWSALFAVATAAIAVRIFIIYLELFGTLAATGGGLITGGALLVALGFGWHRIVQWRQRLTGGPTGGRR